MQSVAEFMKQSACIVVAEQRRFALRRLCEIAYIYDDRCLRFRFTRLRAHRRTPCARAFRAAREVITYEKRDVHTVFRNFPDAAIVVIERQVELFEIQPEQACCARETRFDHPLELQVWLEDCFVQIMLNLAARLGVITPIPRL